MLLQVEKNAAVVEAGVPHAVCANLAVDSAQGTTMMDKASVGAEMAPIDTSLCAVEFSKDGRHAIDGKDGVEGSGSPYNQLSPINPMHLNDILQGF